MVRVVHVVRVVTRYATYTNAKGSTISFNAFVDGGRWEICLDRIGRLGSPHAWFAKKNKALVLSKADEDADADYFDLKVDMPGEVVGVQVDVAGKFGDIARQCKSACGCTRPAHETSKVTCAPTDHSTKRRVE